MAILLSKLGLRAFPPEILELIIAPLLEWHGKTPALLIALRSDRQLYHEALALFCKRNTFKLHRRNEWKTRDMGTSALISVRSLAVDFWSSPDWEEWSYSQEIEPNTYSFSKHSILTCNGLQTVHFNVSELSEFNMKAALMPAVTFAQKLPLLREISVTLPRSNYRRCDDEYDRSGLVSDLIGDFNFFLGVTGTLGAVGARVETGERMVWVWRAREGDSSIGESIVMARKIWEKVPPGLRVRDASCWGPDLLMPLGGN